MLVQHIVLTEKAQMSSTHYQSTNALALTQHAIITNLSRECQVCSLLCRQTSRSVDTKTLARIQDSRVTCTYVRSAIVDHTHRPHPLTGKEYAGSDAFDDSSENVSRSKELGAGTSDALVD